MLLAGIATSGTLRDNADSFRLPGFAFAWYSGIGTNGRMPPPLPAQAASPWTTPAERLRSVPPTRVMKGMSNVMFAPGGRQAAETVLAAYEPESRLASKKACPCA